MFLHNLVGNWSTFLFINLLLQLLILVDIGGFFFYVCLKAGNTCRN